MKTRLASPWEEFFVSNAFNIDRFYKQLDTFLDNYNVVIPAENKIFSVFDYIKPQDVQCVLFGEDPYPRLTSACGVAFWDMEIGNWSDKTNGNSLKNILKALLVAKGHASYNTNIADCRSIAESIVFKTPPQLFEHWMNQGILLVNSALTFSGNNDKKDHFNFWKPFHKRLIKALNNRPNSPFYILWGNKAQKWIPDISETIDNQEKIIKQGHPTFIHQFLDKNNPQKSPFHEIILKTNLEWI